MTDMYFQKSLINSVGEELTKEYIAAQAAVREVERRINEVMEETPEVRLARMKYGKYGMDIVHTEIKPRDRHATGDFVYTITTGNGQPKADPDPLYRLGEKTLNILLTGDLLTVAQKKQIVDRILPDLATAINNFPINIQDGVVLTGPDSNGEVRTFAMIGGAWENLGGNVVEELETFVARKLPDIKDAPLTLPPVAGQVVSVYEPAGKKDRPLRLLHSFTCTDKGWETTFWNGEDVEDADA